MYIHLSIMYMFIFTFIYMYIYNHIIYIYIHYRSVIKYIYIYIYIHIYIYIYIFRSLKLLLLKEKQQFKVLCAEVSLFDPFLFSYYFHLKFRLRISVTYENTDDIIVNSIVFHHIPSKNRICFLISADL